MVEHTPVEGTIDIACRMYCQHTYAGLLMMHDNPRKAKPPSYSSLILFASYISNQNGQ